MNSTLYMRSAKALAAATALSLLLAAGPGGGPGGGGRGPRPQNSQGGGQGQGQGNQQCPPGVSQGQGQSSQGQGQSGNSFQGPGNGGGGGGGGQTSLMDPGGQGGNGENQSPGEQGQGPGGQGQSQGPQTRQRSQGQALSGAVSGYNLNPSGTPESMMLNTGSSTVQLNFPPEMATAVQSAAAVGNQVSVVARTGGPGALGGQMMGPGGPGGQENQAGQVEQPQADHKVMNLESIKSASGQSLSVGGPGGGQNAQVDGTVKRLNYDRRGQIDGAQLDNGDFVHLRPGSDANFTVGEKVTVQGRQRTANSGLKIIEAESINGASVTGNGPGGQGGPGDNGGPQGQ